MATKTHLITEEENTAVSEPLQEIIEVEKKEFEEHHVKNLQFYWERGRVVNAIKEGRNPYDRRRTADYGTNPVDVLADAIRQDRSTLYRAGQFADMFADEKDFSLLVTKTQKHMGSVGFSHVKLVLGLPINRNSTDPYTKHRQLLYKAIEEGWTLVQLEAEVRTRRESQSSSTQSRSRNDNFLTHLNKFNASVDKHTEVTDKTLTAAIQQMRKVPTGEVTFEMLSGLRQTVDKLNAEFKQVSWALEESTTLLARFESAGKET